MIYRYQQSSYRKAITPELHEVFDAFADIADCAREHGEQLKLEDMSDLMQLMSTTGTADMLRTWVNDFNEDMDTDGILTVGNSFKALCGSSAIEFQFSDSWTINKLGQIFKVIEKGKGDKKKVTVITASERPVWADLRIIAEAQDDDGRSIEVERYRFRWDLHSRIADISKDSWKPEPEYLIISAADAVDTRRAQRAFSNAGVFMDGKRAANFCEMMRGLLENARDKLPTVREVSQMGWRSERDKLYFVPYSNQNTIYKEPRDLQYKALSSERGTLEDWVKLVTPFRQQKVVRAAMAAAFASPLIYLMGARNFVFDIYGKSGRGKTVLLELCASIYGNPSGYVSSFNRTGNNALTCAANLQNLPFLLDEMETNKARDDFQSLVYNLVNGETRGGNKKDNTSRKQQTFSNVTICNGEHLGLDFSARGGALNRVLQADIGENCVFGDSVRAGEVSQQLHALHGTAGRAWITGIIKSVECGNLPNLEQRVKELRKLIESKCGCNGRQAAAAALLCATDIMVSNLIFNDAAEALTADDMAAFTVPEREVSDSTRIWSWLLDWIPTKKNHFEYYDDDHKEKHDVTNTDFYGAIDRDGKVYVIPSVIKAAAKADSFILDETVLHDFADTGRLITDGGRLQKRKRMNGGNTYAYCFCLDAEPMTENNDSDRIELNITETHDNDLPF